MKNIRYIKPTWIDSQELEENELMVCNNQTNFVHILNGTASQIWELAEKEHSQSEIVAFFIEKYPDKNAEIVANEIEKAIEDMLEKKILMPSQEGK